MSTINSSPQIEVIKQGRSYRTGRKITLSDRSVTDAFECIIVFRQSGELMDTIINNARNDEIVTDLTFCDKEL